MTNEVWTDVSLIWHFLGVTVAIFCPFHFYGGYFPGADSRRLFWVHWVRCVSQTALQVDFLPLVSRSCSSPLSRSRQHVFPLEPRSRGWSVWFGVPRRRGRILIWNTISQFSLSEQQQLQKGCREAAPSTYFHSNLLENFFVFPIWFV